MPKERLRRLPISQPRVKWSVGASSCSRCSTTEVGIRTLVCGGGVGFSFSLGLLDAQTRPAVLTSACQAILDRGQSHLILRQKVV
jgi:hypothetical protein